MKRKRNNGTALPESDMERLNRRLFRKRVRLIVRLVLSVVIIAVVVFGALCLLCRVRKVEIKNSTGYDTQMLIDRFSGLQNKSLLFVDASAEQRMLVSEFPYIKTASVKTVFPDKIVVTVSATDATISMRIEDGKYIYIDNDLKVLEQAQVKKTGTILVHGVDLGAYSVGQTLDTEINYELPLIMKIIELMRSAGLDSRITEIDLKKKYNYRVVLDNLIRIELGNSENLDRKVKLARQILDDNPVLRKSTVDVHDPDKGRYRIEDWQ